jgi:hypothetical protein
MEVTGILHAHSTYSYDGKLTLSELRALCIEKGIQFVCMTEHTDELDAARAEAFVRECDALSDDRFRFVPGFEVPYHIEGTNEHAHVLMIRCRGFYGIYARTFSELAPWIEASSYVVLAHPVRNHFKLDPNLAKSIHALEVWNQQYEGKRVPRTRSLTLLGELRKENSHLHALGGVDFHRKEHFGTPQLVLDVTVLTEEAIIGALKAGEYKVLGHNVIFYATETNLDSLKQKHRFESTLSVAIIVLGKWVNKMLAKVGVKLPKALKQLIRKRL